MVCVQRVPRERRNGFNSEEMSNFGRARVYQDMGCAIQFQTPNATPGTYDPATGLPLTGDWQINFLIPAPDNLECTYPLGTYNVSWTGTGTGPTSFTISAGQTLVSLNYNGDLAGFTITPPDDTGDLLVPATHEFLSCAGSWRVMNRWRVNRTGYDDSRPYVREEAGATNANIYRLATPTKLRQVSQAAKVPLWVNYPDEMSDANLIAMASDLVGMYGKLLIARSNEVWNSDFPQFTSTLVDALAAGYPSGTPTQSAEAYHWDETSRIGQFFIDALGKDKVFVVAESQLSNAARYDFAHNLTMTGFPNVTHVSVATYFGGPPIRTRWQSHANTADALADILTIDETELFDICCDDWDTRVLPELDAWKAKPRIASGELELAFYEGGFHGNTAGSGADSDAANSHLWNLAQGPMMGLMYDKMFGDLRCRCNTMLDIYRRTGARDTWSTQHCQTTTSPRWESYLNWDFG